MAKELTAREMASMGGRARSEKYSKRQIKAWGKMGGGRPKLSEQEWSRLFAMLKAGKTQEKCAREFNISTRTIGRAVAEGKAGGVK
jgi:DNA invertase Pin-like site-specific DNA recombinase